MRFVQVNKKKKKKVFVQSTQFTLVYMAPAYVRNVLSVFFLSFYLSLFHCSFSCGGGSSCD